MVEINDNGPHYTALVFVKEKGGSIALEELSALKKTLDFKQGILEYLGYLRIDKEEGKAYLTDKGIERLSN